MSINEFIWKFFLDPIIRRIDSRIKHYRSFESSTHQGQRWLQVAEIGTGVTFYAEAGINHFGVERNIVIGDYTHIRGELTVYESGHLKIGHHSFLGPGSRIWCKENIDIGSHVLISHLVDIHDTDSHSLDWKARKEEGIELFENGRLIDCVDVETAKIVIEDHAWIGFKSTILKGVTIGEGAVVAAGSVVTKDVQPYTLVAGVPAQVVRNLPRDCA